MTTPASCQAYLDSLMPEDEDNAPHNWRICRCDKCSARQDDEYHRMKDEGEI